MLSADVGEQTAAIITDLEKRVKRLETLEAPAGDSCFQLIEDQLLTSPAVTFTFSAIPQTYKHLYLVLSIRSTNIQFDNGLRESFPYLRFNNNASAIYQWYFVMLSASTVIEDSEGLGDTEATLADIPAATGSNCYVGHILVPDYANSKIKTFTGQGWAAYSAATGKLKASNMGGQWNSTAAITRIDIVDTMRVSATNWSGFSTGSRISLYGLC